MSSWLFYRIFFMEPTCFFYNVFSVGRRELARLKDAVWTEVTTEVVPEADRPQFSYNTPLPFQNQVSIPHLQATRWLLMNTFIPCIFATLSRGKVSFFSSLFYSFFIRILFFPLRTIILPVFIFQFSFFFCWCFKRDSPCFMQLLV